MSKLVISALNPNEHKTSYIMMKRSLSILALSLLISCAGVKLAVPVQSDVDRMHDTYPDYSLEQLLEGKALYETKCTRCHGLKDPVDFTVEEWSRITPNMIDKANRRQQTISETEGELILRYVSTMAGRN